MATHLITGAGSGIGAAVAAKLLERGDDLILLARSDRRAAELSAQFGDAGTVVADLSEPAGVGAGIREHGLPSRLDSLLHIAGVVDVAPVAEQQADVWADTINVNLLAPAELTRALLPKLRAARGHVVFVNSGSGLRANPNWASYAASKFGLRALADALRGEEKAHGVRVTSVYPGRTATAMQQRVHEQEGKEYDPSDWIDPESVASSILHVLDMPRDAEVTDLRVSPGP